MRGAFCWARLSAGALVLVLLTAGTAMSGSAAAGHGLGTRSIHPGARRAAGRARPRSLGAPHLGARILRSAAHGLRADDRRLPDEPRGGEGTGRIQDRPLRSSEGASMAPSEPPPESHCAGKAGA